MCREVNNSIFGAADKAILVEDARCTAQSVIEQANISISRRFNRLKQFVEKTLNIAAIVIQQ
jgi:hypothetical protein